MKRSSSATGRTASRRSSASDQRSWLLPGIFLLVLLPLIVLAYLPAIGGPFLFDDHVNIVNNPAVAASRTLADVVGAAFSPSNPNRFRPLANASFSLNALVGGMDPAAFRWVNVAILYLSGIVFFFFSLTFCRLSGIAEKAMPIALVSTAFWTMNPLHANDATYIVQRMALLSNAFLLLALLLYLRGREEGRPVPLVSSGIAFLAALGCKETALIFPYAILLLELTMFGRLHSPSRRKQMSLLLFTALAAFFLLAGLRYADAYGLRTFSLGQRLLSEPRVVLLSLSLFLLPLPGRLSIDHDVATSTSLLDPPTTLVAIGIILIVLLGSVALRKRWPFPALCLLLFFLHLVIEFTVIPLELMFEHRILLPAAFISLLAAWGGVHLFDRIFYQGRSRRFAAVASLLAVSLALSFATHVRNRVWASEVGLWEDAARKAPQKARIRNNLGLSYELAGRPADAERSFRDAIALDAGSVEPYTNLALLYESLGRADIAREVLRAAGNRPMRGYAGYQAFNAAMLAELEGDRDEAIEAYRQAIPLFSGHVEIYARLARLLNNNRRFPEAIEVIEAGRRLGEGNPYLLNESGRTLHGLGRDSEAMQAYARNIAANPTFAASYFNLGVLCYSLGDGGCARENLLRFLALAPGDATAGIARGILARLPAGEG